jgi:tRNA-specific 2-thiouridylase
MTALDYPHPDPEEAADSKRPPRVVVAMSGGVDSSVAAALLVDQGYDVVGMMLRLWSEPGRGPNAPQNRCCTPDQIAEARYVAGYLNIPFYVIDVRDFFRQSIVQFFIDEHALGRTPNPCILCNRVIRFDYLMERAVAIGADYLATGHYARVERTRAGEFLLRRAVDESKDQSYVLHVLTQRDLARTMFPVGGYRKHEVRDLAGRFGLPVSQKQESMDLCFLGDNDYRRFLSENAPDELQPGPILGPGDQVLGRHGGLPLYTIGQRKGLGITHSEPLFVLGKDTGRNALLVGTRSQLGQAELMVRQVNWLARVAPKQPIRAQVKIRYRALAIPAWVTPHPSGATHVAFDEPVLGATPGQGAVFYDGEVCLGGGLIADTAATGSEELEDVNRANQIAATT